MPSRIRNVPSVTAASPLPLTWPLKISGPCTHPYQWRTIKPLSRSIQFVTFIIYLDIAFSPYCSLIDETVNIFQQHMCTCILKFPNNPVYGGILLKVACGILKVPEIAGSDNGPTTLIWHSIGRCTVSPDIKALKSKSRDVQGSINTYHALWPSESSCPDVCCSEILKLIFCSLIPSWLPPELSLAISNISLAGNF